MFFDAGIPYLSLFAIHDKAVPNLWRKEDTLVGQASAAKMRRYSHR